MSVPVPLGAKQQRRFAGVIASTTPPIALENNSQRSSDTSSESSSSVCDEPPIDHTNTALRFQKLEESLTEKFATLPKGEKFCCLWCGSVFLEHDMYARHSAKCAKQHRTE